MVHDHARPLVTQEEPLRAAASRNGVFLSFFTRVATASRSIMDVGWVECASSVGLAGVVLPYIFQVKQRETSEEGEKRDNHSPHTATNGQTHTTEV